MSDTKKEFVTWQFCLADSTEHAFPGVKLVRVRMNARGPWTLPPGGLPQYVQDWFCLEERNGSYFVADYPTVAALRAAAHDDNICWQKAPSGTAKGIVRIEVPQVATAPLPEIDGFCRGDGTKWGVSDFYENKEA